MIHSNFSKLKDIEFSMQKSYKASKLHLGAKLHYPSASIIDFWAFKVSDSIRNLTVKRYWREGFRTKESTRKSPQKIRLQIKRSAAAARLNSLFESFFVIDRTLKAHFHFVPIFFILI